MFIISKRQANSDLPESIIFSICQLFTFLGIPTTPAASDLCSNQMQAKISSLIWFNENSRGCSVIPTQKVNLGPFISFPKVPAMIPFNYSIKDSMKLDDNEPVFCLLETADLTDLNKAFTRHEQVLEVSFCVIWNDSSHEFNIFLFK